MSPAVAAPPPALVVERPAAPSVPPDTIAAAVPRTGVHALAVSGVRGKTGDASSVGRSATIDVQAYRQAPSGSRMGGG